MKMTIGQILHYILSEDDAHQINLRLEAGERGNAVEAGEVFPLIVSRVWDPALYGGKDSINGQVMLDGSFNLWVTSRHWGALGKHGTWHWPEPAGAKLGGDSISRLNMELCSSPHQLGHGTQIQPDPEQFATLKESWGAEDVPRETQLMRALYDGETMARVLCGKLNDLPTDSLALIECRDLTQGLLKHVEQSQITPKP